MTKQTPETSSHLHDIGFSIGGGDLTPAQLEAMREILARELEALCQRFNAKAGAVMDAKVYWHISYDGSRECGEH